MSLGTRRTEKQVEVTSKMYDIKEFRMQPTNREANDNAFLEQSNQIWAMETSCKIVVYAYD